MKKNKVLTLQEYLSPFEKEYIKEQLKETGNNIQKTARLLNISRNTLMKKILNFQFKMKVER